MKLKADEILDLLLTEMQKGRSIEDCLEEYPEFAQELEPLLRLAAGIENLPKPEPNPQAIESVLAKVREIDIGEERREKRFSFKKIFSLQPALVRAVAVALLILFIGWTSLSFSAKSVPGDVLYPVKLLTEKVQYILTISPEGKVELHLSFADRRTEELVLIFKEGEALNKELLSAMLNEAQSALKYSESLTAERSAVLIEKVGKCNLSQKEVLDNIRPLVSGYDASVMDEAIIVCSQRCHCIGHKLYPETNTEQCSCLCWETFCDWK